MDTSFEKGIINADSESLATADLCGCTGPLPDVIVISGPTKTFQKCPKCGEPIPCTGVIYLQCISKEDFAREQATADFANAEPIKVKIWAKKFSVFTDIEGAFAWLDSIPKHPAHTEKFSPQTFLTHNGA